MEKTITLRPYDREVSDDVFSVLFNHIEYSTDDGLMEIPSASYQLVVSALESIRWDVSGDDRKTIKMAISIIEGLRDRQKMREWSRKDA